MTSPYRLIVDVVFPHPSEEPSDKPTVTWYKREFSGLTSDFDGEERDSRESDERPTR